MDPIFHGCYSMTEPKQLSDAVIQKPAERRRISANLTNTKPKTKVLERAHVLQIRRAIRCWNGCTGSSEAQDAPAQA